MLRIGLNLCQVDVVSLLSVCNNYIYLFHLIYYMSIKLKIKHILSYLLVLFTDRDPVIMTNPIKSPNLYCTNDASLADQKRIELFFVPLHNGPPDRYSRLGLQRFGNDCN